MHISYHYIPFLVWCDVRRYCTWSDSIFIWTVLVILKRKLKSKYFIIKIKSYFVGFYPFRYIVTLMGFFALFAGTMYNDFLSLSFNTFGSCYDPNILDQY